MEPIKTICENCTGETVVNGYCHNCGAGEKPETEEDVALVVTEEVAETPAPTEEVVASEEII